MPPEHPLSTLYRPYLEVVGLWAFHTTPHTPVPHLLILLDPSTAPTHALAHTHTQTTTRRHVDSQTPTS